VTLSSNHLFVSLQFLSSLPRTTGAGSGPADINWQRACLRLPPARLFHHRFT
jgi:hypothetical protein